MLQYFIVQLLNRCDILTYFNHEILRQNNYENNLSDNVFFLFRSNIIKINNHRKNICVRQNSPVRIHVTSVY